MPHPRSSRGVAGEATDDRDELFAARLNLLFAAIYPPGRGRYRNTEVREMLQARGCRISPAYLTQLRKGIRTRPSRPMVEALSELFRVPVDYLAGEDEAYARYFDEELWWTAQLRDPEVRRLTEMILDLSAPAQRQLLVHADRNRIAACLRACA